ncbi:MAG: hypothetical protein LH465_00665 [Sphingomonas bacterium]|nr:hypothetical protein [Sphingomonas bacterium]
MRAALAGAVAVAAISGYGLAATPNAAASTTYRAELRSLTGGAARGQAELRLAGNGKTLLVHITASGLEAGGDHISHIHGLSSGGQAVDSTCPTQAQDSDGDGFVELAEGQVTYGPILLDFMNIDPDKDGKIDFRKTVRLSGNEGATPLADRHIVIHGMSVGPVGAGTPGEVDGTAGYKTVLPVLCGEIQPAR